MAWTKFIAYTAGQVNSELLEDVEEFIAHYNHERNHQGVGNELLFPDERARDKIGKITKDERLGGLLNYYYRETG